jgi:energy-coupling factor transporter transmembrane protein EcfT
MASLLSDIKAVVLRAQFLATLAMFLFITIMVIQNDITIRAFLLLPVVLSYYLSKLLFVREMQERTDKIIEKVRARQE